jgi:hypothetical protein
MGLCYNSLDIDLDHRQIFRASDGPRILPMEVTWKIVQSLIHPYCFQGVLPCSFPSGAGVGIAATMAGNSVMISSSNASTGALLLGLTWVTNSSVNCPVVERTISKSSPVSQRRTCREKEQAPGEYHSFSLGREVAITISFFLSFYLGFYLFPSFFGCGSNKTFIW